LFSVTDVDWLDTHAPTLEICQWVEANRTQATDIDAASPAVALLYALEEAFP
jgi:hypothetical protein